MASDPLDRISIDPKVMVGKPCIRGTRIPVELVLEKLSGDMNLDEIFSDYPFLERDDVLAAVALGARAVHNEWKATQSQKDE